MLKQALTLLINHARRVNDQQINLSTARADGHLNIALALAADDWPERSSDQVKSISLDQAMDNTARPNPAMSLYVVRNLTEAMGGRFVLERISEPQAADSPQLRYVVSLPLVDGEAPIVGA